MRKANRILIVDADLEERERVVRFLSHRDYAVGTADDGDTAWEVIQEEKPDILILDISISGLDALTLLERVQEHDLPVKVLTVAWDPEDERAKKSLELGATDFVAKPFNLAYLEASIRLARVDLELDDDV